MRQDEVKYQLNDSDKNEIIEIDILSHYWKHHKRNLMVKVTGLYTLGDDEI